MRVFFLHVFSVSRVQQWAVSFGKEIAGLSARYSGAKLLQKVRDHTQMHMHPLTNIYTLIPMCQKQLLTCSQLYE